MAQEGGEMKRVWLYLRVGLWLQLYLLVPLVVEQGGHKPDFVSAPHPPMGMRA